MRGDGGVCGNILCLSLPPLLGRLTVLRGIKAEHQSPTSNELVNVSVVIVRIVEPTGFKLLHEDTSHSLVIQCR